MHRALLRIGLAVGISAAASARADIMHWYWEVEVNGEAVDATKSVVVRAGDQVDIELLAEFEPYGEGFAWSVFAISAGDQFFEVGAVTIEQAQGYGLNATLNGFGDNGVLADLDLSGQFDTIDLVIASQFPPFFNADFDGSNPLLVYRVGWELGLDPESRIELRHGPNSNGELGSAVFTSVFGSFEEYPTTSDALVFVPAPWTLWQPLIFLALGVPGRRRHDSPGV